MKIPFNSLSPLYEKYREEFDQAALGVLSSGWYILGDEVSSFEKEFAGSIGSDHCVGLNSGLDSLILAMRALGIGPGDEIIVQANTYIATVLGITENGATPVFVEPDEYHGINPEKIEKAITSKTRAILAVHLYGQPCEMDSLMEIAQRYDIPVIEDCAQSHGAAYRGQMTGTFGSIGCFSFFPTKNLGAFGDAGAIVTNHKELAEKVMMLRNYGSRSKYVHEITGVNSRLDEMQAALLRVKLKYLGEILEERKQIAEAYLRGIDNPLVELPGVRPGARHTWHLFVVQTERRDELQKHLVERGIVTSIHYPIPPHLSEAYGYLGYGKGSFPITEGLADRVLSLPMYNGMTEEEISYVVDGVNGFR